MSSNADYIFKVFPVSTNKGLTNPDWNKKSEFDKVYTWCSFYKFDGGETKIARTECVDYCGRNTGWVEIFSTEAQARKAAIDSANRDFVSFK